MLRNLNKDVLAKSIVVLIRKLTADQAYDFVLEPETPQLIQFSLPYTIAKANLRKKMGNLMKICELERYVETITKEDRIIANELEALLATTPCIVKSDEDEDEKPCKKRKRKVTYIDDDE